MTQENKTTIGASSGPAWQREPQQIKSEVREAVDDLASTAGALAEEYRGKADQIWADTRQRTRTLQKDGERYVRENPTKAIMTALGMGLLLGLIFRR